MTDDDLAKIESAVAYEESRGDSLSRGCALIDECRALIAEVRRLRAAIETSKKRADDLYSEADARN